ncbi:metallophosphoesterase [Candidatus Pacearchaeota archaeon]|nr:metallophosphoesterase [Candidatus Pacearchaeota archaeon]
MKILAVGDPHGSKKTKKIPIKGVDLILITGDIGKADLARKRFFENVKRKKEGLLELEYDGKFSKLVYTEIYNSTLDILKYFSKETQTYSIFGNVGTKMMRNSEVKKEEKKYGVKLPYLRSELDKLKNFHSVKNRVRNISGLRIGFLEYFVDNCWIKEFNETDKKRIKSARKETEKAERVLNRFGNRLDILVCHQPPYGILDKVNFPGIPENWKGKHAGSKVILDYIKKYQPKYVFCGHIHEAEGKAKIGKTEVYNLGQAGYKIIELNK